MKAINLESFDAVLLIGFGGPNGPSEIEPFLKNVLRGRKVPAARLESIIRHYEKFNGVSPITAITMQQAAGLRARLESKELILPVYVGMRNWHPFLEETMSEMAIAGIKRALALIMAPHHSYSSCGQYKQNVLQARQVLQESGHSDIEFTYVSGWHKSSGFIQANARHVEQARNNLDRTVRDKAKIIFTAHSIPYTMAVESRYETELKESAALIANELGQSNWTLAYQSRSGRPEELWLEPDICDYLKNERQRGLEAAVICPLGFTADHIEVLYDLDHEAAQVCKEIDLPMKRAASVNDDPIFLDSLAEVIRQTYRKYIIGRPLQIVSLTPSKRTELPPPEH